MAEFIGIEEGLLELESYGRPRLFKTNSELRSIPNWNAWVELDVTLSGLKAKVEGEGNTPKEAIANCVLNLREVIKSMIPQTQPTKFKELRHKTKVVIALS